MDIVISKSELYNKLKVLGKLIPQKTSLPAYGSFLFEIKEDTIKITAGDENGRISTTVEATCNPSGFEQSVLLDAKMLLNGLNLIPEQPINISFDPKEKYIKTHVKYNNGKFDIVGGVGEDYPSLNIKGANEPRTVNASDYFYGIKHTQVCCASDDLRPVLTGIFFKVEDESLICVGTDGQVLSKVICKTDKQTFQVSFIIPSKFARFASTMSSLFCDPYISIVEAENNVSFTFGNYHLTCLKIEGRYPNYDAVIPKNNSIKAECSTQDLLAAVKRVSIFSDEQSSLITLSFDNDQVDVLAQDVYFSRSSEEHVPLSSYDGSQIKIAFNSQRLITILSCISDEELIMTFDKPSSAAIFCGKESQSSLLYLIMPLSINH
jgi:DNA polymerase-3 subunit beta